MLLIPSARCMRSLHVNGSQHASPANDWRISADGKAQAVALPDGVAVIGRGRDQMPSSSQPTPVTATAVPVSPLSTVVGLPNLLERNCPAVLKVSYS